MAKKTCYEWALETVTADEHEDILDVDHARKVDDYNPKYFSRALTGERFVNTDIDPERATEFFMRLALTKKVYDEDDDLLWIDYAYVNGAGEFDEFDDTKGLPPVKYRRELSARLAAAYY